jgi:hypothetical protein
MGRLRRGRRGGGPLGSEGMGRDGSGRGEGCHGRLVMALFRFEGGAMEDGGALGWRILSSRLVSPPPFVVEVAPRIYLER